MSVKSSIYNIYSRASQASKSTSSKKAMRKRDISYSLPYSEFPAATGTFTGLAISLLLGLFGAVNTYASSINITLTGNVNLNLVKSNGEPVFGTTANNPQTATITSDHYTGYTLTIASPNNDNSLIGANDNTKFIPSIPTAISESTFRTDTQYNDMWGFLPDKLYVSGTTIDNSNYQQAPKLAGTTIDVTTSPTSTNGNTYNLALGAKVTPAMSLDSYAQTFVLAATGNNYDYHIGYTDSLSTIPADQYGEGVEEGTVTLSSQTPVKAGYVFGGWCSQPTVNTEYSATCPSGVKVYDPSEVVTLSDTSANNIELYAIWSPVTFDNAFKNAGASKLGNYYRMQDMTSSICDAVAIGQEGTLVDNRGDNKTYVVGKMKDGRCWMLDNLALGGSSEIALKATDTNIAADWILPASVSSGFNSYIEAKINADSMNTVPNDNLSKTGNWKVGIYYNFCAATAGNVCTAYNTQVEGKNWDICPYNWRMPSGNIGGEYDTVARFYSNTDHFRISMHLPLSGVRDFDVTKSQAEIGVFRSKTIANVNSAYSLYVGPASVNTSGFDGRSFGFSVRCIAK